jgi:histone H3/H4
MEESTKEKRLPELEPPAASVNRIIKAALPENAQITKEAKAAFAQAAGIFILYLTSCSNDFCHENRRATISSADVVAALKELEFFDLLIPLEGFLSRKALACI